MASARGFTLIEVLVALAVLAVVMGFGLRAFSSALLWSDRGAREQGALALARTLMDRAGRDIALRQGALEGRTADGFAWQLTMTPAAAASALRGMAVDVTIAWTEQLRAHALHLSTLRLAAGEGA